MTELATGQTLSHGQGTFETASIVKLDIAAAYFLRAARTGRQVTPTELDTITLMLKKSNNVAATRLWKAIGGAKGLDEANHQLGLKGSTAGPTEYWGLTRTNATDQLQLLRQVFGPHSALRPEAQAAIRIRMEGVDLDQRWGISATGSDPALKNGWMQRSGTRTWNVSSIGRISKDGKTYLMAVLTRNNPTKEAGVKAVEATAQYYSLRS